MLDRGTNLPSHEADCFHNGGLDNLLTREDTPCNSIWTIRLRVCLQVASLVYRIESDVAVPLDDRKEHSQ